MSKRTILFGHYPLYKESSNQIEWIVLNEENEECLILTKDIIEVLPYNESFDLTRWDECSIRKRINTEFYYDAFTISERDCIVDSLLEVDNNYYVKDKIFLLSIPEYFKYLKASGYETAKCKDCLNSCEINTYKNGCSCWLLRSSGDGSFRCRTVNETYFERSRFISFVSAVGGVCYQGIAVNQPR